MLLKNSAYTVDANLQKHTRAPPRTRSGRFQSTLSVRRATYYREWFQMQAIIFQSTLSVRRATSMVSFRIPPSTIFQSTLSVRRATNAGLIGYVNKQFQSTLSVRRATLTGE